MERAYSGFGASQIRHLLTAQTEKWTFMLLRHSVYCESFTTKPQKK